MQGCLGMMDERRFTPRVSVACVHLPLHRRRGLFSGFFTAFFLIRPTSPSCKGEITPTFWLKSPAISVKISKLHYSIALGRWIP